MQAAAPGTSFLIDTRERYVIQSYLKLGVFPPESFKPTRYGLAV